MGLRKHEQLRSLHDTNLQPLRDQTEMMGDEKPGVLVSSLVSRDRSDWEGKPSLQRVAPILGGHLDESQPHDFWENAVAGMSCEW